MRPYNDRMSRFTTAADLSVAVSRFHSEPTFGLFDSPRYHLRHLTWGAPDAPPVVLVHGLNDNPLSFAMVLVRLVDAGFRCVAYDLADGRDGANLGMDKHPDYAADLITLLDHLGIAKTDILGSSFGSTITLRALAEYPDRFRRAALQGGFPRRPLMRIERGLARLGRYWPWRMGDLPIRESIMRRLEKPFFAGTDDAIFDFLLQNSSRTPVRAMCRRTLLIDKLDLRPLLPKIPHPLLMIGGDRDPLVPRHLEAEVEAGVPNVRRVEFSPCGHYPQYTMPGPMAEELITFYLGERGTSVP